MTAKKKRNRTPRPKSPSKISLPKKLLFSLAPVVAILIGFEIALALVGVKPVAIDDDPLVGFSSQAPLLEVVERDGNAWYSTARNKLRWFNAQAFPVEKPNSTYRIVCLGGSTTYGRPYNDATSFSGWLRELLTVADASQDWEVINAGGISYASYRVVRVMEELARCEPDLFIVYTGHNEFLEERTYRSIKRLPPLIREANAALSHLRTYSLMRAAMTGDNRRGDESQTELGEEVKTRLDAGIGPDDYQRDDELGNRIADHFRFNLRKMTEIARSRGAEILFVTPASNLADCSPFKSQEQSADDKRRELLASAQDLFESGDAKNAQAAVERYLMADPRDAAAHYLHGQVLLELGRTSESALAFERARDEDVCPLRASTRLINVVREVGTQDSVPVVDFVESVRAESENGIANSSLFLDHVHPTIDGHRLLATQLIEEMAEQGWVAPNEAWGPTQIASVSERVKAQIDTAQHQEALKNLAKVLTWAGKEDEAGRLALRAAELDDGSAGQQDGETQYLAGNALLAEGKIDQAISKFQSALRANPNHLLALNSVGSAFQLRGDIDRAREFYLRATKIDPNFAPSHSNLASLYASQNQFESAIQHYQTAININPRYSKAHNNLGVVYRKQKRWSDAEASFGKAIEIDGEFAEAYYNLGTVYEAQRRFGDAARQFQQTLLRNKQYGPAWYRLGMHFERSGNLGKALMAYRQSIRLPNPTLDASRRAGWIMVVGPKASRDPNQAERLAQECLKALGRPDANLYALMAAAKAANRDLDSAISWQTRAVSAAPNPTVQRRLKQQLNSLKSGTNPFEPQRSP